MKSADSFSLLELNLQIKEQIQLAFDRPLWVRAEISELHENASGHAYFELVEKEATSSTLLAKNKATCWANTYRMLKPYFESSTGEHLRQGIKVLLACTVEYHELYGLSLNIKDIDPTFTLGDMARQRMEIINRLQEDGVMDMNKELPLSPTPQRIAILSSPTAAGYGDFMDQLKKNAGSFAFYTKLFPVVMQGEQAAGSIVRGLDLIFEHQEKFDVVVIIRGGGATAELSCFDNYELAFNCTQFPLPIITGIGHERDESIVDMVAHTRCKTPTAVAEFLISRMDDAMDAVLEIQQGIVVLSEKILQKKINGLQKISMQFPQLVNELLFDKKSRLSLLSHQLKKDSELQTRKKLVALEKYKLQLRTGTHFYSTCKFYQLEMMGQKVNLSSPETLLKKGYSLTLKNGNIIRSKTRVKAGDKITTRLQDGEIESIVS